MSPSKNWLSAYYYAFNPTGVPEIDAILSAVARAGKAYHSTQDWQEECSPYEPDIHRGETPVDWIQNAAIDAAAALKPVPAPALPACARCGGAGEVAQGLPCDGPIPCPDCSSSDPLLEQMAEALRRLCGDIGDVLQGWQAHVKLAEGFGGMGHNILTESAGRYGSRSCWLRVERAVEQARAALAAYDAQRGGKRG